MLLKAAQEHDIDLSRSIMVGDKVSDMVAAERAGVPGRYHVTEGGLTMLVLRSAVFLRQR